VSHSVYGRVLRIEVGSAGLLKAVNPAPPLVTVASEYDGNERHSLVWSNYTDDETQSRYRDSQLMADVTIGHYRITRRVAEISITTAVYNPALTAMRHFI